MKVLRVRHHDASVHVSFSLIRFITDWPAAQQRCIDGLAEGFHDWHPIGPQNFSVTPRPFAGKFAVQVPAVWASMTSGHAQPHDNRPLVRELSGDGRLHVKLGDLFEQPAPFAPRSVSWHRVRGMMLGLAIGDALGNTSEGMLPADRLKVHGEVRDYLPNRHAENRPVGLPSDDSQLAFWTLEHLVESGGLFASTLAQIFAAREIFGIGSAVRHFVRGMQEGKPWWQASARSAGNGALMRIAPVTIPHLGTASPAAALAEHYGFADVDGESPRPLTLADVGAGRHYAAARPRSVGVHDEGARRR